jgi:D-3-phosphoglycerate dehydrogenase
VSDHALAMILACMRGLRTAMVDAESRYCAPPRDPMPDLRDMTLGIIGLGRIGGTLCTKVQGLFKHILACDPYIPAERFTTLGATPCDLHTLLAESDAISLHCNLTDETRCMIDRNALAKMKSTAILVNTARGPVVDEQALLEALNEDRLYGAGLDVWCDEPPGANQEALVNHPHVVPSRHCAWFSTEANKKLQRGAARNMAAMLRGETPDDCLNADAFR